MTILYSRKPHRSNRVIDLPPELWDLVFRYMECTSDLKQISLVCTKFYVIVNPILWKAPTLRNFNIEDFYILHRLPMCELSTSNFTIHSLTIDGSDSFRNPLRRKMTLWLFKLIGMMTMLKSLELSGNAIMYDEHSVLEELTGLVNLRSLKLRSLHPNSPVPHAGELMRDLLQHFQLLEEFHLYDKVGTVEDMIQLVEALAQLQSLKRITLSEANEAVCAHLAKLNQLQQLHIVARNAAHDRIKRDLYRCRISLPKCTVLLEDVDDVAKRREYVTGYTHGRNRYNDADHYKHPSLICDDSCGHCGGCYCGRCGYYIQEV